MTNELIIEYRFVDDPEDMVRKHISTPKYHAAYDCFEIMPPQEKLIIFLDYYIEQNGKKYKHYFIEDLKQLGQSDDT